MECGLYLLQGFKLLQQVVPHFIGILLQLLLLDDLQHSQTCRQTTAK